MSRIRVRSLETSRRRRIKGAHADEAKVKRRNKGTSVSRADKIRAFHSRAASGKVLHVPEVMEPRLVADYYIPARTEKQELERDKRESHVEKR
jgi:hypothetical protein